MSRLDRLRKYTYILPKQNQSKQAGSRGWCLRSRENDDGIKTASRPATGYVKVKVMRVGSHAFCDPLFQKILQNKGGGMYRGSPDSTNFGPPGDRTIAKIVLSGD